MKTGHIKWVSLMLVFLWSLNANGQIPKDFTKKEEWPDSVLLLDKKGKLGLFSLRFNELITNNLYDAIGKFDDPYSDIAIVKLKGKLGLIDRTGNEIIEPQYDEFGIYSEYVEGWLKVRIKEKYGFIQPYEGYEVVPVKYDEIGKFGVIHPNLAKVVKSGLTGLIDDQGFLTIACQYDEIQPYASIHPEWSKAKRKGKWGMIGLEGEMIPCIYDSLESYKGNSFAATLNGKTIYLDETGLEFIPD